MKNNKSLTENELLALLGIKDFKHMTKDKIIDFCNALPNTNVEVAKKAFERFPDFAKTSVEIMKNYKEIVSETINTNSENLDSFNKNCDIIINSISSIMQKKHIRRKHRKELIDSMITVLQMQKDMDKNNKAWFGKVIATVGTVAGSVVAIAGAILGAKFINK